MGLVGLWSLGAVADDKPKYGKGAVPLSQSHEFFSRAKAPDFWALAPYYLPQRDERSCSLASLTMLVNAARRGERLGNDDRLVTQASLLSAVGSALWKKELAPGGEGVTLDELGELTRRALAVHHFAQAKVEVVHVPDATPTGLQQWRLLLVENERSARDFVLVNFAQAAYTGDGDGHIAPIGAYDAKLGRVLILDPDRDWYEPYWVPVKVSLEGMATIDPVSKLPRGYVRVCVMEPC